MSQRFFPPRINPAFLKFVNAVYEPALLLRERVTHVEVAPEEWQRLANLRGTRALLLCNHPSLTEPPVLFGLSKRLGEPFYYVASRDLFTLMPLVGKAINALGAFSIVQGGADRESLRMSQEILAERNAKLVILPEGEPNTANDRMNPLNPGAIQTGMWAVEKLAKQAEEGGQPVPSLPVVPIVVKYRHTGDPRPELRKGLQAVEAALGITNPEGDLRERICGAGLAAVAGMEWEYRLAADPSLSLDDRIERLFRQIETRLLTMINARSPRETDRHARMRALFNLIYAFRDEAPTNTSPQSLRIKERRRIAFEPLFRDMRRYENFMTISADILGDPATTERVCELLVRLEREVFGVQKTAPLRQARVRIAEPLDLATYLPDYRKAKRETVAAVNQAVETTMRGLLKDMEGWSNPL